MSMIISLAFLEDDCFFIDGLSRAMISYFESVGHQILIMPSYLAKQADIIFRSVKKGRNVCFCGTESVSQRFFSIREPNDITWMKQPHCFSESGVIYRNEPLDIVLARIVSALGSPRQTNFFECSCYWDEEIFITAREKHIVYCLSLEMTPVEISCYLNISIKTISNHKISVMRKLGFGKNIELYRWLQRGGLKHIRDMRRQSITRRTVIAETEFQ